MKVRDTLGTPHSQGECFRQRLRNTDIEKIKDVFIDWDYFCAQTLDTQMDERSDMGINGIISKTLSKLRKQYDRDRLSRIK